MVRWIGSNHIKHACWKVAVVVVLAFLTEIHAVSWAQSGSDGTPPSSGRWVVPVTPPSSDPAEIAAREAADLAEAKAVVEEYRQAVASGDNMKIKAAWRKVDANRDAQQYLKSTDKTLNAHFIKRSNIEADNRFQRAMENHPDPKQRIRAFSTMEGDAFNRMEFEQAPPDPAQPGRGPDPGLADLVKKPPKGGPQSPEPPQNTTQQQPPEGPVPSYRQGEATVGHGTPVSAPSAGTKTGPRKTATPGVPSDVAGAQVITLALTAEEIIKCREEGLSSNQCASRLVTMAAEGAGISAAAVLTGTVPAVIAVGTVLMTIKGVHDTVQVMYASGSYVDARLNEERIKQQRAQQQELNAPRFAEQTATLRATIISRIGSVGDSLKGACESLRGMAASAAARSDEVNAALAGLPTAAEIAQVRSAGAACEGALDKKARLDVLRDRVQTYSTQVSAALQKLDAKAQACSTAEQAKVLLEDWSACVGLSKGVGQMAAEARGLAGELKALKQQAAQAKAVSSRAQAAMDRAVAIAGRTAGDSGRFEAEAARAEGLNNDLQGRADTAQKDIINLRRAFEATPERDAVFSELRDLVNRYQGGTCPVETYRRQFNDAMASATDKRLDAQNRAAGLSSDMAGLALCDSMGGESALKQLDGAESDAGSYLILNSDIPGRARECLDRAGDKQGSGGGFSSLGGQNVAPSTQDENGSSASNEGVRVASNEPDTTPSGPDNQGGGFGSRGGENVAPQGNGGGGPEGVQGTDPSPPGTGGGLDLLGTSISSSDSPITQPPPVANNFPAPPGGHYSPAVPPVQGYPPSFQAGPSAADMAAAEERRRMNQQMMMGLAQNLANQLSNLQRSNANPRVPRSSVSPATPYVSTPQRPLGGMPRGTTNTYGQQRIATGPATGSSVPPKVVQTEPPPTEAEKQALQKEIEGLYLSKWKKHWCQPSWSGCSIAPSGAKDALVSRAFHASKKSNLAAIRGTLYCWDPCIVGNLDDNQRAACMKRCDQQFGYQ